MTNNEFEYEWEEDCEPRYHEKNGEFLASIALNPVFNAYKKAPNIKEMRKRLVEAGFVPMEKSATCNLFTIPSAKSAFTPTEYVDGSLVLLNYGNLYVADNIEIVNHNGNVIVQAAANDWQDFKVPYRWATLEYLKKLHNYLEGAVNIIAQTQKELIKTREKKKIMGDTGETNATASES